MNPRIAESIVSSFERGEISRRQMAARLVGLGAALGVSGTATATGGGEDRSSSSTFSSTGIDHVALNVSDVARSRDFYRNHLGLEVIREEGGDMCFMGRDGRFFVALFQGGNPGMNHYCHRIENYDPDRVVEALKAAGIEPRREQDRVYFDDPDGIEVQVAGS